MSTRSLRPADATCRVQRSNLMEPIEHDRGTMASSLQEEQGWLRRRTFSSK